MQPNKAATPWGAVSTLVAVGIALALVYLGAIVVAAVPGSGLTLGSSLDEHICVTVAADDVMVDDTSFSQPDRDGVRRAPTREDVCRDLDEFDHPAAVRALSVGASAPLPIAVLLLLLGLRRIVRRTWDDGPFTTAAAQMLSQFRWSATLTVFIAVTVRWVLDGIAGDLVVDRPWGSPGFLWPTLGTFLGVMFIAGVCQFGAHQRRDAYQRGLAEWAGRSSPDDQ